MTIILAIDPGVTGALAFYDTELPDRVGIYDIPIIDGDVNPHRLDEIIATFSFPTSPLSSAFIRTREGRRPAVIWRMFAAAFTTACVVVKMAGIPLVLVTPAVWKKALGLKGGPDGKEPSRARALELFPHGHVHFARKKDHNRAEAALLALYAATKIGVQ